jgi:alpha-L-fucosidase
MRPTKHSTTGLNQTTRLLGLLLLIALVPSPLLAEKAAPFEGRFYRGAGDTEYLQLLDTARRMFAPDPEFQNLAMLYLPSWNGLVEGPTWDAWWIQNSYGTTYSALPFLPEPFVTFLQNSQDLWFSQMGDGQRVGAAPPFNWVAPDGCLCDAARPGWIVYRQGDGRPHIHDWGMEFTAAGLVLQSELLLISRDPSAIAHYLPLLERGAYFIETRRDPTNNLFRAGPAGNLLAPSFAGWKKPDGTYGQAYLTGLSITYIAALDRLIELEKLAERPEQAKLLRQRRDTARQGLAQLTADEGYFINSLDPDGTRHGVFGAARHGYFESSPNHDAIAFRIADDDQAERIYAKIASIPGLRPHQFILPNYPSYDDMYEKPEGLWSFGTWVNGGHWSTCEARMMLGYYRLGKYEDARRSMRQLLTFAERFRMDNPLVKFGSEVYQPGQPINLTYDAFGPPAAFVRGLFEYGYHAEGLTLWPHIPPSITRLEQRFPIRLGTKQLYLAIQGTGSITAVNLNDKPWKQFDARSVQLPYDALPATAAVEISLGGAQLTGFKPTTPDYSLPPLPANDAVWTRLPPAVCGLDTLLASTERLRKFYRLLVDQGLAETYAAAHARLALDSLATTHTRLRLLGEGKLKPLANPVSQAAADQLYFDTARKLADGLSQVLAAYDYSSDSRKTQMGKRWQQTAVGSSPIPSPQQLVWQRHEVIAFAHFGMNTFTDREWGDGKENPQLFNPTDFDARQWASALQEAGIKLLILTAKHHDGFCLWPSKFTEHCVRNSPWRNGKGDVVREVVDALREKQIRVGLYLSPWDRNQPTYGDSPKYNEYFRNQLRELLTIYGPIDEVWFDGACGEGPNGKKQEYDWPNCYSVVRQLQPSALIAICGPDIRSVGNESGVARDNESSVVMRDNQLAWHPAECDVSIRPGWFYHAGEDNKVKSLATLADIYFKSAGRNSVLLLNVPPNRRGRIADADVTRLKEFGAFVRQLNATDFAANAVITASSHGDPSCLERHLTDHNLETCWMPAANQTTGSIEFDLGKPQTFNVARLQEDISRGERVQAYHVEILESNQWRTVTAGQVIGHKQLRRFPAVTAQRIRLVIDKASSTPALAEFGLHFNPLAPSGSGALTAHRPATASDVHPGGTQFGPDKAVDDDPETRWATSDHINQAWIEVELAQPSTISRLAIQELDPRLSKFQLQYRLTPNDEWKIAYEGTKAGTRFTTTFTAVQARYVRLNILDSTRPPTIWEFQVFAK